MFILKGKWRWRSDEVTLTHQGDQKRSVEPISFTALKGQDHRRYQWTGSENQALSEYHSRF